MLTRLLKSPYKKSMYIRNKCYGRHSLQEGRTPTDRKEKEVDGSLSRLYRVLVGNHSHDWIEIESVDEKKQTPLPKLEEINIIHTRNVFALFTAASLSSGLETLSSLLSAFRVVKISNI